MMEKLHQEMFQKLFTASVRAILLLRMLLNPAFIINNTPMMLSSISVSRVQPLAPPSPNLKLACLLCILGSISTAFPSILTNQKPYSSADINGFELSLPLPHPLSTFLTLWLSFLIKSPVSVSSCIQISLSMLTSPRCAKSVIFISDHFYISDARLLMTGLFWLLLRWSNHTLIKFKICTLTYKLLSVNQPANLESLITSYVPPRLLKSSDQCLLTQPRTRTCIDQRAFSVCAPAVWNSLPMSIRLSPTLATFKHNLIFLNFAPL